MTIQESTTIDERSINLSIGKLDYSGTQTKYIQKELHLSCLEDVLKSNNYSFIRWADDYRDTKKFRWASGFCIDIDGGLTIEDAETRLKEQALNYALITTRSHTPANHRFRILVPFTARLYTLHQYQQAGHDIDKLLGTKCDQQVFDGARQLYGSPKNAYYSSNWDGHNYDVRPYTAIDLSSVSFGNGDWDDTLIVVDKDGKRLQVKDISEKTPIHCPWHDDKAHSAFVAFSDKSDNWFIHCGSCAKTFWKTKPRKPLEVRCARFWSHTKNLYETGIVNDAFYFKEITEKKFDTLIDATTRQDCDDAFRWIMKHHHIPYFGQIDYMGDASIDHSTYMVDKDRGIIEVRHAPIAPLVQDNQLIEDFLKESFGPHKEFIKKYLAVYAYTNYRKLPTLILVGKRGAGKNIFAEMVSDIYRPLSTFWSTERNNFNPELTKKLLIADETVSNDARSYRDLKRISGQARHPINQKFTPAYEVKNNANVIILSNNILPIFADREELPTSVKNNQFFVFEMKPIAESKINAELANQLRERLGHYVRTVLLDVYQGLDISKFRYSIPVPITHDEIRLFKSSISTAESMADRMIEEMIKKYADDIKWTLRQTIIAGRLPLEAICKELSMKDEKNGILKNLRERGYLTEDEPKRRTFGEAREYAYIMTDKFKAKIKEDIGTDCFIEHQSAEQSDKTAQIAPKS